MTHDFGSGIRHFMTHTRDNYHLTDELAHFDLPAVCALIQTASWATKLHFPVSSDGAQTLLPHLACVKRVPSFAMRSNTGVWINFCP
jgi:hypothetical protein